ncbi:MAG TPA: mRNA surveillance protein pelota [Nitrosopumilaceae archaeon]|nr:mRNA surveillance protein pelota [Nitrosopumilaceae archaeon]
MITKIIDENSISVIPEDSDDLFNLRRIIKEEDTVVGDTTRVIKQDKDYSRPDKGERIRVRIALMVEKISLDEVLDRLRIGGTISESSNEMIPHGSHHSFILKLNDGITITKKNWLPVEKNLMGSNNKQLGFLLVAIDTGDCGIARLKGTHLQFIPNIYSGSGGKRYKTNFNIEKFFEQVQQAIFSIIKEVDSIIIFGPGETKKRFANFLQKPQSQKFKIQVVEGIDSGGEDGIYIFTKSQAMKEIMSESKLAKVSAIIDEIMIMANKKSRKFTMGFEETFKANQFGAVESLVFSDKIIQTHDEKKIIDFLNDTESKGVKTYGVDSSTDLGLRVTGLGGIVSVLRFPVES